MLCYSCTVRREGMLCTVRREGYALYCKEGGICSVILVRGLFLGRGGLD